MGADERFCDGVIILDVYGARTAEAVDVGLWDRIKDLARRGHHQVVLNLEHAPGSNSFAVSTLLGAKLTAHNEGSELKLLHA